MLLNVYESGALLKNSEQIIKNLKKMDFFVSR
jgi:predicted nucleic acid-binding protein